MLNTYNQGIAGRDEFLSLQKFAGGFEIDQEFAKLLGLSCQKLKEIADGMEVKEQADKYILLSTAMVLSLLVKQFYSRINDWGSMVEKCEKWFQREMIRTGPRINGLGLRDWSDQFIEKIKWSN